tara:strand:- start:3722 stop:4732 length:1011 start_codon:yes stop_codon:yes gene_type:complete
MNDLITSKEDKSVALRLWGLGGSRRSLWCSINKNDYLDLVDLSIVQRKKNVPVASISLIKRSYIFNNKKVIIYAMHRMISYKDSGNLLFNILVSICSRKNDHFIASTANKKGSALYKRVGFVEAQQNIFLHTYLLNPVYLPMLIIFASSTLIKNIFIRIIKVLLPIFYYKKCYSSIKIKLENHIQLRKSNYMKEPNSTTIDWECNVLSKYLDSLIKGFRLNFCALKKKNGEEFSLLITTRFNHIWRSCTIADSTYKKIDFLQILEKCRSRLVLNCLSSGAIRLYIRSIDSNPPLKCVSFIHIKKQKTSNLILNGQSYFSKLNEQDLLSSLHGDSFL